MGVGVEDGSHVAVKQAAGKVDGSEAGHPQKVHRHRVVPEGIVGKIGVIAVSSAAVEAEADVVVGKEAVFGVGSGLPAHQQADVPAGEGAVQHPVLGGHGEAGAGAVPHKVDVFHITQRVLLRRKHHRP